MLNLCINFLLLFLFLFNIYKFLIRNKNYHKKFARNCIVLYNKYFEKNNVVSFQFVIPSFF